MYKRQAQIETMLEQQWFVNPAGDLLTSILQVSDGFTYAYDPTAPIGSRIDPASIELDGVMIEPATEYRVTVNSFLAEGGDNFFVLAQGTSRLGGDVDLDALEKYFLANPGGIAPGPQNRISLVP